MGPLLSERHKKDRIDSEKCDEVNQPIERQNLRGKITRTRTSVTRLQAKERGHDFDVEDYERTRKDGHKRPIFTDKSRTYNRSHSESLQKSFGAIIAYFSSVF